MYECFERHKCRIKCKQLPHFVLLFYIHNDAKKQILLHFAYQVKRLASEMFKAISVVCSHSLILVAVF